MKMQSLSKVLITVLCVLLFVLPVCAVDYIGDINYAPSVGSDPGIGIISDTPIPVFGAGDYAVLEIPIKPSSRSIQLLCILRREGRTLFRKPRHQPAADLARTSRLSFRSRAVRPS